jgi:hypothetical protein
MWARLPTYFKGKKMKNQENESVPGKNGNQLNLLIDGYLLNCMCEGLSNATIDTYRYRLTCFKWFCQAKSLPQVGDLKASHIKEFI